MMRGGGKNSIKMVFSENMLMVIMKKTTTAKRRGKKFVKIGKRN